MSTRNTPNQCAREMIYYNMLISMGLWDGDNMANEYEKAMNYYNDRMDSKQIDRCLSIVHQYDANIKAATLMNN